MAELEPATAEGAPAAHPASVEDALAWIGFKLDEIGGATAGRVEGVFVDVGDRLPAWLVVRLGRFGRRSVIPFEFAAGGAGRVWLPCSRAMIRSAPEVDPAVGLTAAHERKLAAHFGLPSTAGRVAAIAGRPDDQLTALPAG